MYILLVWLQDLPRADLVFFLKCIPIAHQRYREPNVAHVLFWPLCVYMCVCVLVCVCVCVCVCMCVLVCVLVCVCVCTCSYMYVQ